MPWPKGRPHTALMKARRLASFMASGGKRKRPVVVAGVTLWQCGACRELRPATDYHRARRSPNGLKAQCKRCHQSGTLRARSKRDASVVREQRRIVEGRRRARQAGVAVAINRADYARLREVLGTACLKCLATDRIQWDHVIPIARGGTHSPINLQPLCRPCNEKKQARTMDYRTGEQRALVALSFRRLS